MCLKTLVQQCRYHYVFAIHGCDSVYGSIFVHHSLLTSLQCTCYQPCELWQGQSQFEIDNPIYKRRPAAPVL